MITIKELLTTYWSQTTLILFAIGFIAKSIIDLRSKKIEINHSLFQQKRLESLNMFFSTYVIAEQMWISISIWDILENKLEAAEIDEIIIPHFHSLRKCLLELQIYFKEDDHKNFVLVYQNIKSLNLKLGKLYFDFKKEEALVDKANEFQLYRDKILAENDEIFKTISQLTRKTF